MTMTAITVINFVYHVYFQQIVNSGSRGLIAIAFFDVLVTCLFVTFLTKHINL